MINLEELERLARAATPGPWEFDLNAEDCGGYPFIKTSNGEVFFSTSNEGGLEDNGKYISAANPQVVLKLIEALRVYEDALRYYRVRSNVTHEYTYENVTEFTVKSVEALAQVAKILGSE